MAKYRRGRLSDDETKFIKEHPEMSIEDIAHKLRRKEETIQQARAQIEVNREKVVSTNQVKYKYDLETRPWYPSLKKEFSEEELQEFHADWISTQMQFGGDVTHTEEKQIKEACRISILMSRVLQRQRQALESIEYLQDQYDNIIDDIATDDGSDDGDNKRQNIQTMNSLDQQMSSPRAAASNFSGEYDRLGKAQKDILKDMKASRNQRFEAAIENKTTIFDLFQRLENDEYRLKVSRDMERRRIAMEKERMRLGKTHTYVDGTKDQPILNWQTIQDEDNRYLLQPEELKKLEEENND